MPANIADKLRKTFNITNPETTFVTTARTTGNTTLLCDNLSGWPDDTAVDFITYQLDADEKSVKPGTQTDWKGLVSGSTLTNITRVAGEADSGNSVNDIVQMVPTGSWANDIIKTLLGIFNQDGSLKDAVITAAKLATNSVTANAINFASMTSHYKKLASNTSTTSVSAAVLSIPHGELVVGGKYEVTAVVVINTGATNSDGDFYIRHGTTVMTEGLSSGTYWNSIPLATQITYSSGGINLVGNSNGKTISAVGTTLVAHRVG